MRDIVCLQREILIVDLPQQGEGSSEMFGRHYAVAMNYSDIKCNTVLIVPLSSKKDNFINRKGAIDIGRIFSTDKKKSTAVVNQLRCLDKDKIIKKCNMTLAINQFDMIIDNLFEILDLGERKWINNNIMLFKKIIRKD